MATFHENLKQSFKNFKNKYIGNVPSGVTLAQINADLSDKADKSDLAFTQYTVLKSISTTTGDITVNNLNNFRLIVLMAGGSPTAMVSVITIPIALFKSQDWTISELWSGGDITTTFKYVSDTKINITGSGMYSKVIGVI
jgi:hypothetical protein